MAVTRVLPPFAAAESIRPQASVRRAILLKAAARAGVRVWENDDAVALEYADGDDDFWISDHQMATARGRSELWAEELLEEYRSIDVKRTRVLKAVRHALAAAGAYANRARTGFWTVVVGATSPSFEAGSALTSMILDEGEAEALRHALGELALWHRDPVKELLRTGPEGADWPDAAVRMGSRLESMSLKDIPWANLHCLLHSGVDPRNERTWEEYEALNQTDASSTADELWRQGPELPRLTDALAARLHAFVDSTLEQYHRRAEEDPLAYRLTWPWLVGQDRWTSLDWHLEAAAKSASRQSATGGRLDYSAIAARIALVQNGRDAYRLPLFRDLDQWWDGGAHDLQDWPDLVALFPRHPAGTEIRDSHGVSPPAEALASELPPRRFFRESLLDGLRQISGAASEEARLWALDDFHAIVQRLGPTWARRLLRDHETVLAEARRATGRFFDLPGSELFPWFDDLLAGSCCLGWSEVGEAASRHPDLSGMLFNTLAYLEQIDLNQVLEQAACEATSQTPSLPEGREPERFLFSGRPLLMLSHLSPDPGLARLAASALLLCLTRRSIFDDQLAAAIAWHRCQAAAGLHSS